MNNKKRLCGDCAHYCATEDGKRGECRINPPVFITVHDRVKAEMSGPGGKAVPTVGNAPVMIVPSTKCGWPLVFPDWWCSKWVEDWERVKNELPLSDSKNVDEIDGS